MYYDIKASGQRIQQLRKAAGFTLEGLSDRLNITDRQLRRIEKGESGSSVDLLIELACVFEVSLDYLILGKAINKNDAKNVLMQAAEYLTALADKSCE